MVSPSCPWSWEHLQSAALHAQKEGRNFLKSHNAVFGGIKTVLEVGMLAGPNQV